MKRTYTKPSLEMRGKLTQVTAQGDAAECYFVSGIRKCDGPVPL